MAKLILLRGNSGSGKTSVARAVQHRLGPNTMLLSQDAVRRDMLWVNDGADTAALPLLLELLEYGRTHCEHVILEGILNARWYRPLFEAALDGFGGQIYAYYYDLPFEETLRRHQTRAKKAEFGEAELRSWWMTRNRIGFLPEQSFGPEVSLEDAVERILADVSR